MSGEIVVTWSIAQTARLLNVAGAAKLHAMHETDDTKTLCGIDTAWDTAGAIWESDGRIQGEGAWVNCNRCLRIMEKDK